MRLSPKGVAHGPPRLAAARIADGSYRGELWPTRRATARRDSLDRDVGGRLFGRRSIRRAEHPDCGREHRAGGRHWVACQHAIPADGVCDGSFDDEWTAAAAARRGSSHGRGLHHRPSRRRPVRYQRRCLGCSRRNFSGGSVVPLSAPWVPRRSAKPPVGGSMSCFRFSISVFCCPNCSPGASCRATSARSSSRSWPEPSPWY